MTYRTNQHGDWIKVPEVLKDGVSADWSESYVRVRPALLLAEHELRSDNKLAARRALIEAISALCETLGAIPHA